MESLEKRFKRTLKYDESSAGLSMLVFGKENLIFRHQSTNYFFREVETYSSQCAGTLREGEKFSRVIYPVCFVVGKLTEKGVSEGLEEEVPLLQEGEYTNLMGVIKSRVVDGVVAKGITEAHIYFETPNGCFEGRMNELIRDSLVFLTQKSKKRNFIGDDYSVDLDGPGIGASLFVRS
jgi:hypothetical protein